MAPDLVAKKRNVIFISHATPEDNEFTIWLASRLQADGYEVWIDKQALLGGEKFWQEIDLTIRNRAEKVLLVYSENICFQKQPGNLKTGIEKEKSLAESVAVAEGLKDFLILLNIDGSAYNHFIGADMLNLVPFFSNWAVGYAQLLKKLQKDGVLPTKETSDEFSRWYEDEYITTNGIKQLSEIYYDCWWPIPELPETYYLYEMQNDTVAKIVMQNFEYPISRRGKVLASFCDSQKFILQIGEKTEILSFKNKYPVSVKDVINHKIKDEFLNRREIENHLRSLLQRIFHLIMRDRGLGWQYMASTRPAYFFTSQSPAKIHFIYKLRSKKRHKNKKIYGKYLGDFWHYALSAKPILTPQLAFGLKSHILFTTDGMKLWEDKNKMHTARRKKGRRFFNEDWRDLLFAFLHALCKKDSLVRIDLSPSFRLSLKPWTNT